jgi:hypothetical protein
MWTKTISERVAHEALNSNETGETMIGGEQIQRTLTPALKLIA